MVLITKVTGAYKPTYNWGGPHCSFLLTFTRPGTLSSMTPSDFALMSSLCQEFLVVYDTGSGNMFLPDRFLAATVFFVVGQRVAVDVFSLFRVLRMEHVGSILRESFDMF